MKTQLIYLLFLSIFFGYSQQEPKIFVATDTTQIKIGEQFQYQITIDKKTDVKFPVLSNLGLLEVISADVIDTLKNNLVKKYTLTGFDSGSFYIPKQQVFIKDKAYYTDSLRINVGNIVVDTVKQKAYPIKSIVKEPLIFDDFKPYFSWFYLIVGSLILLISLFFLFKKKNKKIKKRIENIPAYQEAIQKFTHLDEKDLLKQNQIKEYYIELTEIIRVYLGKEVNVHTLETTTDELISLINDNNSAKNIGISKESIQELQEFLEHADFVKFAKLRPNLGEIKNDRNIASSIVEEMQPLLQKYSTRQKELQEERAKEEKPKKNISFNDLSQRSKIFIAIILFSLCVVVFFGYQIYRTAQIKKGANSSPIEITDTTEGWSIQNFGAPALILTAPGTISLKSDEVPAQIQSILSELNVYSYTNLEANAEISVTTLVYSLEIKPDIEQVVESTISNLEKTQKIEDLEFDRQPASFGDEVHGVYLKGSYVSKGVKKGFNLLGFSQENKVWQVFTNANFEDKEAQTTMDTVIQSIKFEKE
jgi:hypothetical protein